MGISERTKKRIWAKSGGKCAFPGCGEDLIGEKGTILGEVCHIVARKEDGPRGKDLIAKEQIDKDENLILLCAKHHKIIDDEPDKYTTEILKKFKAQHEERVKNLLAKGEPWKTNFSQIYYMNLRRIEMLAAQQGIDLVNLIPENRCLHSLGWNLNGLMLQIGKLIDTLYITAAEIDADWSKLQIGQFAEIRGSFRTKNVPSPTEVCQGRYFASGDLKKDAHLYCKYGTRKCVLTIDPHWMATTTSFVSFSSGSVDVAGLGMITQIRGELMLITPYILGVPKTRWDDIWSTNSRRVLEIDSDHMWK